jgi:ParB family chromosome partitioning protein
MTEESKGRRTALGRGLSALLGEVVGGKVLEIPVKEIVLRERQPREHFDPRSLKELKESIARYGLLQPLVVRRSPGGYELIAGERRLNAVKELGWEKVLALVVTGDFVRMELALIENIQRENLSPVEEARAYVYLMDLLKITQEELAERVQKSRPYVANKIRLLHLPEEVQILLQEGKLSEGHARALLSLKEKGTIIRMAEKIATEGMTVREVEKEVKKEVRRKGKKRSPLLDPDLEQIRQKIVGRLGVEIRFHFRKKRKEIHILCENDEEFLKILTYLGEKP